MTSSADRPPPPGTVLGYAYLWSHEAEQGREEAIKDRPCAVLLTIAQAAGGTKVAVLPITSSPPDDPSAAFEIPVSTRVRLGLQREPCWVVLTEANVFLWPGPDLRRLRRNDETGFVMGMLPRGLFAAILAEAKRRAAAGRFRSVPRT